MRDNCYLRCKLYAEKNIEFHWNVIFYWNLSNFIFFVVHGHFHMFTIYFEGFVNRIKRAFCMKSFTKQCLVKKKSKCLSWTIPCVISGNQWFVVSNVGESSILITVTAIKFICARAHNSSNIPFNASIFIRREH